jgi:D-alanyl-lipoteichoic acid acyltransferase DltB (MBOAT superfamily)
MTLTHILVFSLTALLAGWLIPRQWRIGFLLVTSLITVYWLQPSTPIRNLDFWLPSASIFVTIFVWAITQQPATNQGYTTWIVGVVVCSVVLAVGLTRYVEPICCLIPSRPPAFIYILLAAGLAAIVLAFIYQILPRKRSLSYAAIGIILVLFIILKTEPFSKSVSAWLRATTGQPIDLAGALDVPWLGFSYLAFRLLHVLRDYQSGKLPSFSLGEFINYAIFFPTFTAGPIDRSQRFIGDLRKSSEFEREANRTKTSAENTIAGVQRIVVGVFKKFALADSLAVIALDPQNAAQTTSSFWMWILLISYGLRIYFDFAGYTDIAIGLGKVMGFKLPENFDRPYLKQNLTAFWNSWHITLAQWFRAYYFNPLTRNLRTHTQRLPTWAIILIGQLSTMMLIGLWHGVTWNFLIWGSWHGLGLFLHNRWTNWIRPRIINPEKHWFMSRISALSSWLLTFLFITLGWVWFALPSPELAWNVFTKLAGLKAP